MAEKIRKVDLEAEARKHEFERERAKVRTYIDSNPLYKEALKAPEHEWMYDDLTSLYKHHPESFFHSVRVSDIYTALNRKYGNYTNQDILLMARAALGHDFGKIDVDIAILNKPGPFEGFEYDDMKWHLVESVRRFNKHGDLAAAEIVEAHHFYGKKDEKKDRSYPSLITKPDDEALGIKRRRLALSDMVDAYLRKRIYKPKFDPKDTFGDLVYLEADDPQIVYYAIEEGLKIEQEDIIL